MQMLHIQYGFEFKYRNTLLFCILHFRWNNKIAPWPVFKYQKISMHLIKTTMTEPKPAEVRCSLGIILEQLALLLLVLRSPVVSACCDGKLLFFPHAVSLYICDLFYTVGSLHRQAWTYLHIPHTEKCAAVLAWH